MFFPTALMFYVEAEQSILCVCVCVCVCVCLSVCLYIRTITFELNDPWPRYFACWFTVTYLGQIRRTMS